jgi:hypothetical protein
MVGMKVETCVIKRHNVMPTSRSLSFQTKAPVTMPGDPVFERLANDGAPIEDVAHEIPEIGFAAWAQTFLGSKCVLITPERCEWFVTEGTKDRFGS